MGRIHVGLDLENEAGELLLVRADDAGLRRSRQRRRRPADEGIEQLLEMILLQADVLELKANPNRLAKGIIVEDIGQV